jgi:hypothetical protein
VALMLSSEEDASTSTSFSADNVNRRIDGESDGCRLHLCNDDDDDDDLMYS